LEILSVKSVSQLAMTLSGLSSLRKLAQAKRLRIVFKKELPTQLDGEPSIQKPGELVIEFHSQAVLLKPAEQDEKDRREQQQQMPPLSPASSSSSVTSNTTSTTTSPSSGKAESIN
jgi:diacylglycerol kinase (ATP)